MRKGSPFFCAGSGRRGHALVDPVVDPRDVAPVLPVVVVLPVPVVVPVAELLLLPDEALVPDEPMLD